MEHLAIIMDGNGRWAKARGKARLQGHRAGAKALDNVMHYCREAARCREQFDFIFADPPYALPQLESIPDCVMGRGLLRPEGLFVLEHGKTSNFASHPCFVEERIYGSVHFSFFQEKEEPK